VQQVSFSYQVIGQFNYLFMPIMVILGLTHFSSIFHLIVLLIC